MLLGRCSLCLHKLSVGPLAVRLCCGSAKRYHCANRVAVRGLSLYYAFFQEVLIFSLWQNMQQKIYHRNHFRWH